MTADRHLDWDGSYNARDLGGLRTRDGGETRWGAVVRAADPSFLTAAGWSALWEHGVRTVLDLTGAEERQPDTAPRPSGLTTVRIPLEDPEDEFWDSWERRLTCTPLYYSAFLDHFPQRTAEVLAALAHARPGGVLIHCGSGRDRTGLVVLVLLALVGVSPEDIATDHALSHERLRPLAARLGRPDDAPVIKEVLAAHNTTDRETIAATLAALDPDAYLRSAGLGETEIAAVRTRLHRPAGQGD